MAPPRPESRPSPARICAAVSPPTRPGSTQGPPRKDRRQQHSAWPLQGRCALHIWVWSAAEIRHPAQIAAAAMFTARLPVRLGLADTPPQGDASFGMAAREIVFNDTDHVDDQEHEWVHFKRLPALSIIAGQNAKPYNLTLCHHDTPPYDYCLPDSA